LAVTNFLASYISSVKSQQSIIPSLTNYSSWTGDRSFKIIIEIFKDFTKSKTRYFCTTILNRFSISAIFATPDNIGPKTVLMNS